MKKTTVALATLLASFALVGAVLAATKIVITNGRGYYATNYLSFTDSKGTQLILDGLHSLVTLTYPDQKTFSYPYNQKVAGNLVTGLWKGKDEWGYSYIASATETLIQVSQGGSGRGGGYHTTKKTVVGSGTITYFYFSAYAPPLLPPAISGTSTPFSITLNWTSATGGVPPYSYALYQNGFVILKTTGLTTTIKGLSPNTGFTYSILTIDHAGREVRSRGTTIYTLDD